MTYMIIPTRYIEDIDYNQINESSARELIYSLDRSQCIASYNGDQPEFCFEITGDDIGFDELTPAEVTQIIGTRKWRLRS